MTSFMEFMLDVLPACNALPQPHSVPAWCVFLSQSSMSILSKKYGAIYLVKFSLAGVAPLMYWQQSQCSGRLAIAFAKTGLCSNQNESL